MKTPTRRRFVLDANPDTAPGCVEILCPAAPDLGELVQTDWNFPATARRFGWTMRAQGERCAHAGTDGTIDCPECGKTASQFIHAARNWIDAHDGKGILE